MAPWNGPALLFLAVVLISPQTTESVPVCNIKGRPIAQNNVRYRTCLLLLGNGLLSQPLDTDPRAYPVEVNADTRAGVVNWPFRDCKIIQHPECEDLHKLFDPYLGEIKTHNKPDVRIRRSIASLRTENPLSSFPTTPAYVEMLQKYYHWRQKKGYGKTGGRWGRSVNNDPQRTQNEEHSGENPRNDRVPGISYMHPRMYGAHPKYERLRYKNLLKVFNGIREKRSPDLENLATDKLKMSPQLMKMLYEYGAWRSKNGYGKLGGRYG